MDAYHVRYEVTDLWAKHHNIADCRLMQNFRGHFGFKRTCCSCWAD